MKNMKKLLSAVGLLAVAVPASLAVVACGPTETKDDTDTIINSINEITDLGINISSSELEETVIAVLNNEETGLAAKISKHQSISKNFKKELFELDVENVYKGAEKDEKVTPEEQIEINQTYYFNFSYNKKANNVLVAVKVIDTEQAVVDAIKGTSYTTSTIANTSADAVKETINVDFIKNKLTEDIQSIFNDEDFSIVKITNAENTEITDQDFQTVGTIEGHIVFNYATVENQETNLTITVEAKDITKEEFNEKMTERSESDPFVFTVVAYKGSNLLPEIIRKAKLQIKEAFLKDYGLKIDTGKFEISTFSSEEMEGQPNFTNKWFEAVKRFNAKMTSEYDGLSVDKVNVVFDVVAE